MKLLILGGHSKQNQQGAVDTKALFEEVASSDITVYTSFFDTLVFDVSSSGITVQDTHNNMQLHTYDKVILRGIIGPYTELAYTVSIACEKAGIPVLNSYKKLYSLSKLVQSVQFYLLGLPFPRTVYALDRQLMKNAVESLGLPAIVKDIKGAHGNENYLAKTNEELEGILQNTKYEYIGQSFIQNSGDYRVLLVGNEAAYIYREAVEGSHLNNTSQGAAASLHSAADVPELVTSGAKAVAGAYDSDIAGIDVLKGADGSWYFLEINKQPQLYTGAFLEEKKELLRKLLA